MLERNPQPRVEKTKDTSVVTTGTPKQSGFPARLVLTACFALSSGDRAFLHTSQAMMRKHRGLLDASVEASRPHDFAVRADVARLAAQPRPSHPAPNVRGRSRNALLIRHGTREIEEPLTA